jgi:hypothetical protein
VAIAGIPLASNIQDADSSGYGTPSISPTANRLILAWIASTGSGGVGGPTPSTPSLTGAGMTWTYVWDVVNVGVKITLFRALSASPGSGSLSALFGGGLEVQTNFGAQIAEFSGVDTSGTNGSGAVLQPGGGTNTTFASNTSITFTFTSPLSNPNNAVAGALYRVNTGGQTNPGAGFTELGDAFSATSIQSQYKTPGQTTVPWSWASSDAGVDLPVEIKAGQLEFVGMIPIL